MKDGIKPCYGLTEKELNEIKELSLLCNEVDGMRLKLNWDMLRKRSRELNNDFLYYKRGLLVGFLGIYSYNSKEAEISGMVHPEHRRLGIFRELTEAAAGACRRRSFPKLIFICPRNSATGKSFLDAISSEYSFSEYRMERVAKQWTRPRETVLVIPPALAKMDSPDAVIRLRKAVQTDLELQVQLTVSGFSMSEQDAREYVSEDLEESGDITYIAELGEIPVGKISIQLSEVSGFIYGFCVAAEFRGKGYGRQILAQTIQTMTEQEPDALMALMVAVENEGALGLYLSCGFQVKTAYDYYELYL